MTTRRKARADEGPGPHWKIRLFFIGGHAMYLASSTEPVWTGEFGNPLDWTFLEDVGDTVAFIDWTQLAAVSWRYSP